MLCIAHRLRTILAYDRICVCDDGRVAEYDTPLNLFEKSDSLFRGMCERTGIDEKAIRDAQSNVDRVDRVMWFKPGFFLLHAFHAPGRQPQFMVRKFLYPGSERKGPMLPESRSRATSRTQKGERTPVNYTLGNKMRSGLRSWSL